MKLGRTRKTKWDQDRVVGIINTIILVLFGLIIAYPLYFVVIASISEPSYVNSGQVLFLPKNINVLGYLKVLRNKDIITGAVNSVIYTVGGTFINVFFTMLGAYALSVKFPGRGIVLKLITFTMFFSGGMIPSYLLIKSLGLYDTRWALIIPTAISAYNLFVARTFIETNISRELYEAAEMDGCSRFRFYRSIVLPLSASIIAILALFYASGHWNSYMGAVLYLSDRSKFPLQMIMREILIQNQVAAADIMSTSDLDMLANQQEVADLMKYALIVITTLPMMLVYPFIQKHFVKGVMVGSVKG